MRDLDFKVLELFDNKDWHDVLWWRVDPETRGVRWLINCNDLFAWACADCEEITEENFPLIEQCVKDMEAADPDWIYTWEALELWVARIRKERPQGPAYPNNKAFWPLFDAAGPERPIALGNPCKPEDYRPENRYESTAAKKKLDHENQISGDLNKVSAEIHAPEEKE